MCLSPQRSYKRHHPQPAPAEAIGEIYDLLLLLGLKRSYSWSCWRSIFHCCACRLAL